MIARVFRAALPFIAPAVVLAFEWKLLSPTPALADHFQFWAAGHLVASGMSPYDRDAWVSMAAYGPLPGGIAANTIIQNLALTRYVWLYPPQTAFAFAPFGALPIELGIPLLHAAVALAAIAGVVYAARAVRLTGSRLALALSLVAISQPFVIAVRDGHPLGVILGGLALAYVGVRDRRALPLAAGAALVSIKPHIAIAFALLLVGYFVMRREWRLLGLTTAAVALVTIPAELATPFPIGALLSATDERLALDLSNLAALSRDLGDGTFLVAVIALAAVAAGALAVRAAPREHTPRVAFAAALALSLVLSPYAHDYDQLLNVPAGFVGLILVRGTRLELPMIVLFALLLGVAPWVLFFWYPLIGQEDRVYQAGAIGALPVLDLFALATASLIARDRGPRPHRAGIQGSPGTGTPVEAQAR